MKRQDVRFQPSFGRGKRAANWERGGITINVVRKLCAECSKPFHCTKRPKAEAVDQFFPATGTVVERWVCKPCSLKAQEGG